MATWHQQVAASRSKKKEPPYKPGFTLVTDGVNIMRTTMYFGQEEERAKNSVKMHRINQPDAFHVLYFSEQDGSFKAVS